MSENPMADILTEQKEFDPKVLLTAPEFVPHWCDEMTDEEYHSDKTAVGSSSLRKLLDSPKAFYHDFFLGIKEEETDALRIGKLCHLAILEGSKFKERYVVMPEFTGYTQKGELSTRSKEALQKKAAWLADQPRGAVICTEAERDMIVGQIESILSHPQGLDTIKNGIPERAGYFFDPETKIRQKIKPDLLGIDYIKLTDFKTAQKNSRRRFGSAAFDHRYDIQIFMYGTGVKAITGKFPEISLNLTVEKKPPFECAIYYWDKLDLAQAEDDYYKALIKLRKCIDSGEWGQRQKSIQRIYTPSYFIDECAEEQT